MMRVCIVGFGLIGGSLGMALKSRLAAHVSAVDREAVLASSQAAEASDERIPIGASDKLERAVREADLTVVAVPVLAAVQMLPSLLDSAGVSPTALRRNVPWSSRWLVTGVGTATFPAILWRAQNRVALRVRGLNYSKAARGCFAQTVRPPIRRIWSSR